MINAGFQNTHRTGWSDENIESREERIEPPTECIAFADQFGIPRIGNSPPQFQPGQDRRIISARMVRQIRRMGGMGLMGLDGHEAVHRTVPPDAFHRFHRGTAGLQRFHETLQSGQHLRLGRSQPIAANHAHPRSPRQGR